jgi:hypothetical protein
MNNNTNEEKSAEEKPGSFWGKFWTFCVAILAISLSKAACHRDDSKNDRDLKSYERDAAEFKFSHPPKDGETNAEYRDRLQKVRINMPMEKAKREKEYAARLPERLKEEAFYNTTSKTGVYSEEKYNAEYLRLLKLHKLKE